MEAGAPGPLQSGGACVHFEMLAVGADGEVVVVAVHAASRQFGANETGFEEWRRSAKGSVSDARPVADLRAVKDLRHFDRDDGVIGITRRLEIRYGNRGDNAQRKHRDEQFNRREAVLIRSHRALLACNDLTDFLLDDGNVFRQTSGPGRLNPTSLDAPKRVRPNTVCGHSFGADFELT